MRTGRKTVRAEGTAGLSGAAEGDGVAVGEEQAKPDAKWRGLGGLGGLLEIELYP